MSSTVEPGSPPRVWDRFLTERDRAHIAASPKRDLRGFGKRPAVLSVDNYRAAVGDEPQPLLEAIRDWPNSTGLDGWAALDNIARLLDAARRVDVPVMHLTGLAEEDSGIRRWQVHGLNPARTDGDDRYRRRYDIVEQAAPPGEVVLRKTAPSVFFGTPLMAHLNRLGVDTLVVCGEAISGCVRATVVDGCSYRFRMIVVEDCVYDRYESSAAMNLFDMNLKYADVLPMATVVEYLQQVTSR